MKMKTYTWIAAVIMILTGIWTARQAWIDREYRINNVSEAVYENHLLYGIDLDGDHYHIFRAQETGEADMIRVPVVDGDRVLGLSNPVVDSEGHCYLYGAERSGEQETGAVYEADFEEKSLTKRWSLPDELNSQFWFLLISDGSPTVVLDHETYMDWYTLKDDGSMEFGIRFQIPDVHLNLTPEDDGSVWFYDMFGNIYTYDSSHSLQLLFENDGTQTGVDNINIQTDGQVFQFYNITEDRWYEIDRDDIGGQIRPASNVEVAKPQSFDQRRMDTPVYKRSEDLYVGVLPLEDGRQVPVVYGSREQIYDPLIRDGGEVLSEFALSLIVREAALFLLLTAFWLIFLRKKRFPLWQRVLALVTPIMFLGYVVISAQIDRQMNSAVLERHLDLMLSFGETRIQELNAVNFVFQRDKDILAPGDDKRLIKDGVEESEEFEISLYYVKNGEIYNASGINHYNVPLRHTVPARIYEAMETAVRTEGPAWLEYNDSLGRWHSMFLPIKDKNDGMLGLLQVNSQIDWELAEGLQDSSKVHRSVLILNLGIVAAVFVLLRFNMRFLEKLLYAVERAAGGDRSVRVKVRGHSEAAVAGRAFNEMLADLDQNLLGLEAYNQSYQAFVPQGIFKLMGHQGVDQMRLGDEKEIRASILSVGHPRLVSGYLEQFLSRIREKGGVAGHITDTQMDNIFAGEPAEALDAAVSMLQRERDSELHMGISYGDLRLGIIGGEGRREVKMISDSLRFGRYLMDAAGRFGAALLVSDGFLSRTGAEGETYHRRLLGYIYISAENRLEPVWEILDGESQELCLIKEETKERFEQGVRLFMAGQFAKARREFILVLERNGSDRAASRYSFLCDQYLGETWTGNEIYLEKFI